MSATAFAEPQEFGSLLDEWVIPPFSVLDTRQGYWQERRRRWLAMGMQSELGRADGMKNTDAAYHGAGSDPVSLRMAGMHKSAYRVESMQDGTVVGVQGSAAAAGTSIFDPVLCEVAYRWWCTPGGTILDPFAGGSVRGIVAAKMGHPYIGIDLSERQLAANRAQAAELLTDEDPQPLWYPGDSRDMDRLIPDIGVDLVFTCPPYYDLEVYSDHPADLSAMATYAEFREAYRAILASAVARLPVGGFATVVVSEVRGADGTYLGLVPDTIAALADAGAAYYNEAILVNSAGSLPLRVGQQMKAGRKLGRTHQNVIVGRKGAGSTRAWDYQRATAPDPQLAMFAELVA